MLWILLFGVGFALFFCGMPKFHDDFWYMWHLNSWYESQGILYPEQGGDIFRAGIPWQGIWDTWREHYWNDNIRLCNLIAPFFLLFPKWLGSGVIAILWLCDVMLGLRLAGVDWKHSRLVPLALFCWAAVVPWSDDFGCLVYQLNYVIPTFLSLLLLNMLASRQHGQGGRIADISAAALLAMLVGWSHEGFGAPMAAALGAAWLGFRSWRRPDVLVSCLMILACTLILLSVPGMQQRITGGGAKAAPIDWMAKAKWFLKVVTVFSPVFCASVILFVVTAWRKRLGKDGSTALLCVLGVNCLVSVALGTYTAPGPRIFFWLEFCSVVLMLKLILMNRFRVASRYSAAASALAFAVMALTLVHLAYLDIYAFRFRRLHAEALAERLQDHGAYLFDKVGFYPGVPFMLGKRFAHADLYPLEYTDEFYGIESPRNIADPNKETSALFPQPLSEVDDTTGEDISGGEGLRLYKGCLYMPYDKVLEAGFKEKESKVLLNADYGRGPGEAPCYIDKFISPVNEKEYVWVVPKATWPFCHFRTLRGATLRIE